MSASRQGILWAVSAYGLWGVLPIYWKALLSVPAPQILSHRIVWSFVFLGVLMGARRQWRALGASLALPTLALYGLAAAVLAVNWLTYIWAVNAGRIVETSLGYFINPLVSVVLGVVCLRERLRRGQWLAVAVAGTGVAYLTWRHGSLPWVALVLAGSFALYGLLKKRAPLGALHGLTIETGLLWLPAVVYLGWLQAQGAARWGPGTWETPALLIFTGVVTATPLLLFAAAAQRIHLSTIGLLQYLAPTCQLAIGVGLYREPFDRARLFGFALIWTGLVLYSVEGWWRRGKASPRI